MIWVVAGTINSRHLIKELLDNNYPVLATTATDAGKNQLSCFNKLKILVGKLTIQEMQQLIRQYQIKMVIDATHPYAVDVSSNVIQVSQQLNINYIRFERKSEYYKNTLMFDNYQQIVDYLKSTCGNILLTTGSNNLAEFKNLESKRLYIRVLPVSTSIEKCKQLAIPLENIIAIKGPFSLQLNKAILKEYKIKYLVTKESGTEGGVKEKIQAARQINARVLLLKRPHMDYPAIFFTIKEIINYIEQNFINE